jgi:hypothetical protein
MSEENFKTHAFGSRAQEKKTEPHANYGINRNFFDKVMSWCVWTIPDKETGPNEGISNPVRWCFQGEGISGKKYEDLSGDRVHLLRTITVAAFTFPSMSINWLKSQGWVSEKNYQAGDGAKNWGIVLSDPARKTAILNFHQSHRKSESSHGFCEEICAIMNRLGKLGYVMHKMKNADGTYRNPANAPKAPGADDADDKWGQLFQRKT